MSFASPPQVAPPFSKQPLILILVAMLANETRRSHLPARPPFLLILSLHVDSKRAAFGAIREPLTRVEATNQVIYRPTSHRYYYAWNVSNLTSTSPPSDVNGKSLQNSYRSILYLDSVNGANLHGYNLYICRCSGVI